MISYVAVDHPRFSKVQRDIFLKRVTPDCMNHRCSLVHENQRLKLDACCQYGAQADVGERDRILEHADEIRALLDPRAATQSWFTVPEEDKDFASGLFARTTRYQDGCVFLAHDQRGCAIHRASVEGGWDYHGIKPHICRLFPLSYETDAIVLSDDYDDYSCAQVAGAPTTYRVGRPTLAAVFGQQLADALDAVEARLTPEDQPVASEQLARRAP